MNHMAKRTYMETFTNAGGFQWNVTKANEMLDKGLLPEPVMMPIARQVDDIKYASVRMSAHPTRKVDLNRPCIFVDYGKAGILFIDGYHRVEEAHKQGMTHLPMVPLRGEQEKKCRLGAGSWAKKFWKALDQDVAEANAEPD